MGSILQTAAGLGVVCAELSEAHKTGDEPPGSGVVRVADKATYMTTLRLVESNEACEATDEPPISGREDVTNEPADSNRQSVQRRIVCLRHVVDSPSGGSGTRR